MDNTIKTYLLCAIYFLFSLILFQTCKEDKWIEWKVMNTQWLAYHLATDTNSIQISPSGLQYRILSDPNKSEARPNANSTVLCSYELRLIDGTLVDQVSNGPISLSTAIAGFVEGVRYIHVHGDIEIWVPASLGYGSEGNGSEGYKSFIPPYSTLYFKIHLSQTTVQ